MTIDSRGSLNAAYKKLSKLANDPNFDNMVKAAVNLGARNSPNFASKDLAMLQLCDLAKMYKVKFDVK